RGGVRRHRQCVQQRSRPAQRRRRRRALALAGRTGADRRRTRAGRSGLVVRDLPQRRGGPLMAPRWRFGFRRRQGGEPTPEEREAHIAELRRKRQARLRYLTLRAVLVAGALGLVLVVGLYWLLTTVGGREFLLAQIVQRLPGNATLTWESAEGPASGPLTLHDVRFTYEAIEFTAHRMHLDPAISPLLGRRLRLD